MIEKQEIAQRMIGFIGPQLYFKVNGLISLTFAVLISYIVISAL